MSAASAALNGLHAAPCVLTFSDSAAFACTATPATVSRPRTTALFLMDNMSFSLFLSLSLSVWLFRCDSVDFGGRRLLVRLHEIQDHAPAAVLPAHRLAHHHRQHVGELLAENGEVLVQDPGPVVVHLDPARARSA